MFLIEWSFSVLCGCVDWQRGNLALHHAAMTGHSDIVSLLIAAGSDIDAQDKVIHLIC